MFSDKKEIFDSHLKRQRKYCFSQNEEEILKFPIDKCVRIQETNDLNVGFSKF